MLKYSFFFKELMILDNIFSWEHETFVQTPISKCLHRNLCIHIDLDRCDAPNFICILLNATIGRKLSAIRHI